MEDERRPFSLPAHLVEKSGINSIFFAWNGSLSFSGCQILVQSLAGPSEPPSSQHAMSPSLFPSFPSSAAGESERLSSRVTACDRVFLRRRQKKKKRVIMDSGTFLSLIDRIGTRQRPHTTTFINVGGSLFHTGHRKRGSINGSSGSFGVDSHRTNQQRHKDTLMLKVKTSGNAKEVGYRLHGPLGVLLLCDLNMFFCICNRRRGRRKVQ